MFLGSSPPNFSVLCYTVVAVYIVLLLFIQSVLIDCIIDGRYLDHLCVPVCVR